MASSLSFGLPKILSSNTTIVSAAIIKLSELGFLLNATFAFSFAICIGICSNDKSDGKVSAVLAVTIEKLMLADSSKCFLLGDCEAKIISIV